MAENKKPIYVAGADLEYEAASHEDPANPGVLKKVLFSAQYTPKGKLQMVNWACMPPGKTFQRHYHQDMCEVFIITKGQTLMIAGDQSYRMKAGDAILIPENCQHEMSNTDNDVAEYVVFGISQEQGGKTINV